MTLIKLDKERELRFNMKAIKAAEGSTKPRTPFFLFLDGSVTGISVLLWAGLRHERDAPSQDDVDEMIDRVRAEGGLNRLVETVTEAIKADMKTEGDGPPEA